jgi:uncharacterized protein YbjQ (UPF0145 family)
MSSFKCPVCKTGTIELDDKGKKGKCSRCGTTFTEGYEERYVLKKLGDSSYSDAYKGLRKKQNEMVGLKPHEWESLADGGMTDEEKKEHEANREKIEQRQKFEAIIATTTPEITGKQIIEYKGIITGQVAAGVNFVKDAFADIRNVVGGRSKSLQKTMAKMREEALYELKEEAFNRDANAIVGVTLDFDDYGEAMLLLTVTGTAVVVS